MARLLFRLIVAAGLTGYILWRSDPRAVAAAAAGADWRPIAVAVLLVLVDRALMAYRWIVLLCTVDRARRPGLGALLRIFFVSTFVGTFLPASVGGDAVRAFSLARQNVGGGDAVASVFMDRILGVASLLVMALVGLMLVRGAAATTAILWALAAAGGLCFATLLLIFSRGAARLAARYVEIVPSEKIKDIGHRVLESIQKYSAYPRELVLVLVASVAVQILRIVQAYYLGRALGITAPMTVYLVYIPLILLVMLLPVTFNGIGTSQAAFVWSFAQAGVDAAAAFALSVLFVALGIVGNLPGGFLYAIGERQPDADRVRS
jgi:glycosyltransferase 2 family protein